MLVLCPNCNNGLPPSLLRTEPVSTVCSACSAELTVEIFPALFRTAAKVDVVTLAEGEAGCYEHPNKRAVALCNGCGRFLCGLCEVEVGGNTWCPECLGTDSASRPRLPALETRRTLYDSLALALATWPVFIFFYACVFTAPAALYVSIRYWKEPSSLVPRNKWRLVAAILIALVQLGLMAAGIVAVVIALSAATKAGASR